jgi:predicted methyltransferase
MRLRTVFLTGAALASFMGASSAGEAAPAPPAEIAAAVADSARPEADRQRDADRKPAELLAFAGVAPGSKVAEMLPGGGYFTRIFSKAVGSGGAVYALVPPRPANAPTGAPDFAAPMRALSAEPAYSNVTLASLDPTAALAEPVDVIWTSLNYHDLHNRPNADLMATNTMALNALKPGGVYIVIDHAAMNGSGKRDTQTLHRIDPDLVKAEVLAAGFEFAGESMALRNPADDRSAGVRAVPRGKTDQFVFKFRKPVK